MSKKTINQELGTTKILIVVPNYFQNKPTEHIDNHRFPTRFIKRFNTIILHEPTIGFGFLGRKRPNNYV